MRVLLVDDDPLAMRATYRILNYGGFTIEQAFSGKEAIEKLDEFQPNVVVTDFSMPEMNGNELGQWLMTERPGLKVVMFSSDPPRDAKAHRVLHKYDDMNNLNRTVRELGGIDGPE